MEAGIHAAGGIAVPPPPPNLDKMEVEEGVEKVRRFCLL